LLLADVFDLLRLGSAGHRRLVSSLYADCGAAERAWCPELAGV